MSRVATKFARFRQAFVDPGEDVEQRLKMSLGDGWMPAHPTFYIRRDLIKTYGLYETHYFTAADYEFMARYLYRFRVSAVYLPKLIIKMRVGGQSNITLQRRFRANRRDYLAMKKNKIPFPFLVSILKPIIKLHQYYYSLFHKLEVEAPEKFQIRPQPLKPLTPKGE